MNRIIFLRRILQEKTRQKMSFSVKIVEYAITGLRINSILADEKLLKIENIKEQAKISQEIQDLIKNYKEPDLTLFMSHSETKTIEK